MSSQACFLPVPKEKECTFNVSLKNYFNNKDNPSVLAIVATSSGTSAQLLEDGMSLEGGKLYFNNNGQKASFLAQRLSDNRRERGVSIDAPISSQEREQNIILIIQVPLKLSANPLFPHNPFDQFPNPFVSPGSGTFGAPGSAFDFQHSQGFKFGSQPAATFGSQVPNDNLFSLDFPAESDVEHTIVKVGQNEGKFPNLSNLSIVRDTSFPVRLKEFLFLISNPLIILR